MKIKLNSQIFLFCTLNLILVFIFYYPTIFYQIKAYDEIVPFKETHLPICYSLGEIFELISLLGLKLYFEASNTLYSNIVSIRTNPVGDFFVLLVQFLFKKNPVLYHSYSFCLHLINTALVFLILNKVSSIFYQATKSPTQHLRLVIVSLFTLLWAMHPVTIESVLLLTNYNPIFTYTLSLLTTFIYLSFNSSFLKSISLFILFLIALFTAEYLFMLPFILFGYTMAMKLHFDQKSTSFIKSFTSCFKSSLQAIMPLFIATFLFVVLFLASGTRVNIATQSLRPTLERIFWLSPQIFFHFLELMLFPIKLSVDQSLLVTIGKSYLAPYSIFCIGFITVILLLSIFSLIKANKHFPFFFIIFFLFFISLLPFLQIIAPLYNLASERYLYFPSFILIFGLSHLIFFIINKYKEQKKIINSITILLLIIVTTYSARAFARTLDWKDSESLYMSAINTTDNPLFKAYRYKGLVPQEKVLSIYPHEEVSVENQKLAIYYLNQAIHYYKKEKEKYQSSIPKIVKCYGLDPETFLDKAGYLLAHSDFTLNNNPKKALEILEPYVKDLSKPDSAILSFYASLLVFNERLDDAEKIYRFAYKQNPFSTRIIFPLCQLIYRKSGDLNEVEKISLKAFKYFPYDPLTLLFLIKIYKLKNDYEKFAYFSYVYGLRQHKIEYLQNSYNIYLQLNKKTLAEKIEKRISENRFKK